MFHRRIVASLLVICSGTVAIQSLARAENTRQVAVDQPSLPLSERATAFQISESVARSMAYRLETGYAESYAGITVGAEQIVLDIKAGTDVSWLEREIERAEFVLSSSGVNVAKDRLPIIVRERDSSAADIAVVRHALLAAPELKDRIVNDWLDAESNGAGISILGDSPADDVLGSVRSTVPITVLTGETTRGAPALGRANDSAPHYGGLRTYSGGSTCTGGFVVYDLNPYNYGARYMLTSAHCAAYGTGFYNGSPNLRYVGTNWDYYGGYESLDTALLSGSTYTSYGYVYSGGPTGTVTKRMKGADPSAVYVCGSGAVTGFVATGPSSSCGVRDDLFINVCHTYDSGQRFCGLDMAVSANNWLMWQGGDSGGPVIVNASTGWWASGIINGAGAGYFWYSDIGTLLNYWYVAIET